MYVSPLLELTKIFADRLLEHSESLNHSTVITFAQVFKMSRFNVASVPGFSFMQYGCGAENTAKKKKSLVDFDHVGTVTCNGMQFCHTSYLGVK